jgi:hypothetical protein
MESKVIELTAIVTQLQSQLLKVSFSLVHILFK